MSKGNIKTMYVTVLTSKNQLIKNLNEKRPFNSTEVHQD